MIKPPNSGHDPSGGSYTYQFSSTGTVTEMGQPRKYCFGSMASVNTPGWHSLSRAQRKYLLPWQNFNYSRRTVLFHPGTYGYLANDGITDFWRQRVGDVNSSIPWSGSKYGPDYSLPFPSDLGTRTKALSRVQNAIASGKVNLGQAYGERKQTVNMVAKYVNQTSQLVRDVKHGQFDMAWRRLKDWGRITETQRRRGSAKSQKWTSNPATNLSNYWLEYQYGWKPLLADIYGSCEAIADKYYRKRPQRFTGSSTEVYEVRNELMAEAALVGDWVMREYVKYTVVEHSRYVIDAVTEDPVAQQLSATGMTNPFALAWELLPYSFVVDWFVPVGEYIKQLDYAMGMGLSRGSVSFRRLVYGESYVLPVKATSYYSNPQIVCSGIEKSFTEISKSRSIFTEWPYQEFPQFKAKLGTERVLSGIALITQQFFTGKTTRK